MLAVPQAGLAAITSPTEHLNYQEMTRQEVMRALLAHQHVVETVMREYPILPVKFGTVLPGPAWLDYLLTQGSTRFREAITQFANQVQIEVVVSWELGPVFQAISNEPKIVDLKNQIASRSAETTVAERVALGQAVQESIERHRTSLRDQLLAELQAIALEAVSNPPMDDTMVANVALLLDIEGQRKLDQRLDELDKQFNGFLHFRCVGPLPPYSFATVHVHTATFEQIDAARQHLGLEPTASLSAIKRAYRQQAGQLHPDLNPEGTDAEARMNQLSQAYQLLTTYSASHTNPQNEGETRCDFSREAVERTLLISIHAQK